MLCRQVAGDDTLLRLVRAPDGRVVADIHEKLPGRGAWVHLDRPSLDAAIARGTLARALAASWRQPVGRDALDPELGATIDRGLRERVLGRLGLLRRSGQLVLGADASRMAARAGKVTLFLLARDAGEHTRSRILSHARALGVPVVDLFDRSELALALGRDNVVQAALTTPLPARFARDVARLRLWSGAGEGEVVCMPAGRRAHKRETQGGALRVAG
ncbi:MAG: DUF448 domain-containing protein [Alphaproteobacteria bacterium]|nr:MAG: DUF448 domain-containing protein [Alphaproteobacteria bacterium]